MHSSEFTIGGEADLQPFLTGDEPPPPSAMTDEIFVTFHAPDDEHLRRDVNWLLEAANLSTNTLGGSVTQSGLAPYDLCGGEAPQPPVCLPGEDDSRQPHTTPSFLAPSERGLSQLRLGWNALTASWRNELPAGSGDLRAFSTLQFRASVNFADARNPVGIAQDFTITLEDGTGDFEQLW